MATIDGTTGDDLLIGTSDNDVIDGGAGNDQLFGDLGSDVYVFGLGYGHDRIFNAEPEQSPSVDRILLNPGVSPADVDLRVVTQDAQGNAIPPSLLLTLRSSGETLLVYGNYDMSPGGYLNAAIDSIEFADGTVWNWMEIEQRSHQINGTSGDDVLVGGSGDEVILAGAGNDVLIGGEGRDTLVGEGGSDTYVFGYGAGHDVVINSELESEQSVDRIHLAGVAPSDVALSVVTVDHRGMTIPASLLLTLRSTGETLLVREHFESQSGAPTTSAIDFIEFTDGTVWNRSDIQQLAGGGEPVSYITGTPWNDTLWGTSGNDVIDGGSGDDYMWGGEGSDTYVFGHGYGHDRISNTEPYENLAIDRIRLLPGVTPEDVELREVVQDVNGFLLSPSLQLRLRSTGETLIVLDSVESNMGTNAIDFIEFADGTVWDKDEITRRARLVEGTPSDDFLVGSVLTNVLDGGAGNDVLIGGEGSDTYVFGLGYGHDQIDNWEPDNNQSFDRILLKPDVTVADVEVKRITTDANGMAIPPSLLLRLRSTGETLMVRNQFSPNTNESANPAIDFIEFSDGTIWDRTEIERRANLIEGTAGDDWLIGSQAGDVMDGGAGNDHLNGDLGSDTYVFGLGSGHDVIHNQEPEGMTSSDRILLKPEVTAADVELRVVTMDANGWGIPPSLQLRLKSTGETLTVLGHFDPNVWGEAAITTIEFADGTVWDQTEIERRAHLFEGTPGDDQLIGTAGNDVLDGGAGNDMLAGDLGSDTYVFGLGSGHDVIHNQEPEGMSSSDRILLEPEVTAADVELRVVTVDANGWGIPPSLQLRLKNTGETVTVIGHFDPNVWGEAAITTVEFADGTVWDQTEIERRAHLFEGTPGDDWIMGSMGNDVLDGGAGNDMLSGGDGSDTYVFGLGSGHDQIYNYEPEGMTAPDRILLKPEMTVADVELRVVTMDANGWSIPPSLQLRLKSTGETVVVHGHFDPNVWGEAAITTIEFADGTVWDRAEIERRAHLLEGTPGDDWLIGTMGDDTIDGGAGNDMLAGDLGSDTYVFGQGSGHDVIHNQEPEGMTSSDRILLKPEVTAADVELQVVTVDANGWGIPPSLQLRLKSTGETVTVMGHFDPNVWGEVAITTIEFADGTVWNQAEIERRARHVELPAPANYIYGTTDTDWITGTAENDEIDAGAGVDYYDGGLGSDIYVFGFGSGHDTVFHSEDPGLQSIERIRMTSGVAPEDVELMEVTQDGYGNPMPISLLLRLRSTGESLRVYQSFESPEGGSAIDYIEFADGTVWDRTEIQRQAHLADSISRVYGTTGGDLNLVGTAGDDLIDGGAESDRLIGLDGSDTYFYGLGYGHDRIYNQESESSQSVDRIRLMAGIGTQDVELKVVTSNVFGETVPESLQLRLLSTGETLLVLEQFESATGAPTTAAIDYVEFADGTVWDKAEIERRARLIQGTAGDDVLVGSPSKNLLDGGAGDDLLLGLEGSDTYIFGHGYGHDQINNYEPDQSSSIDRIQLNADVHPDDVEFRMVGFDRNGFSVQSSLLITLRSTGETLLVEGHFDSNVPSMAIDAIEFADGTVWGKAEIEQRTQGFEGTAGDDFILGSSSNDVIKGGDGNDQLQGMGGDDVLDGGAGNDMLLGDQGSDTYLFGQGSGHDYVSNYKPIGDPSVDRILLKPGISADDVELRLVTEDPAGWYMQPSLQLRLRSTGDTLVVFGHFDPNGGGNIGSIDLVEFADGTVWDKAEIERRTHLFEGTAGDDVITATEGNDVLDGGAGNDVLLGNLGSDIYVFGEGYGHDVVHNQELEGQTSTDRILLKPGITPQGVKLEVVAQDQSGAPIPDSLLLRVLATGETLLIRDHFVLSPSGSQLSAIDSIEFADGTVWDRATIDWRARLIEGTAGDDVLTGTARNDVLDGGAGNDTMNGGLGDDTYVVNSSGDRVVEASGAGTDTVLSSVSHTLASNVENLTLTGNAALNGDGNGLNNALFGNDGNNLLNGFGGHDVLNGGSGNDRLDGGSGNDTLAGGLGADVLLGGSGNDVYQFGRGDGVDVVRDTGGNADVMSFLSGIEADQLWFRKTGSSLEISVIGTADKVTLSGWYSAYRIEEFKTADGKTLLDNDVHKLVQAMAAFAPPSAGQTTLPESSAAALSPVIAANWQ